MSIKVMIVDDEAYIRKILKTIITRNEVFEVVGECDNMTEALLVFNENKPQVVFMDIEIKGSSGIDCAKVITNIHPDTKIIFATAHSEYMANAFEMYAFDYLVKPFDKDRIEHTLERIENIINSSAKAVQSDEMQSAVQEDKNDKVKDKLMIKGKENVSFVDVEDIVLIERSDSCTHIYTANKEEYITSASLSDIEARLDDTLFMRSHKSYIINLTKVKKIEPYGRWTYVVYFKGFDKDALLTKEKYDCIRKMYE